MPEVPLWSAPAPLSPTFNEGPGNGIVCDFYNWGQNIMKYIGCRLVVYVIFVKDNILYNAAAVDVIWWKNDRIAPTFDIYPRLVILQCGLKLVKKVQYIMLPQKYWLKLIFLLILNFNKTLISAVESNNCASQK